MGILSGIFGDHESYIQGKNWADRVFASGDTLSSEEAASLGQEYADNPQAFYDGYREHWNDHARDWNMHVEYERNNEEPQKRGFFSGLFG